MRKYAIITDSTSDLNHELRTKYQIDYCQMNINNQGKEYPASLDWEIYSAKELYDWMRGGISIKTTQVPYKEFYLKFKSYLEQDMDILYLSCSSALSGSINTALSVKNELIELIKMVQDEMYPTDTNASSSSLDASFGSAVPSGAR